MAHWSKTEPSASDDSIQARDTTSDLSDFFFSVLNSETLAEFVRPWGDAPLEKALAACSSSHSLFSTLEKFAGSSHYRKFVWDESAVAAIHHAVMVRGLPLDVSIDRVQDDWVVTTGGEFDGPIRLERNETEFLILPRLFNACE